ncbi:hypothetical protein TNCV_1544421 [Trichonephila clavipes]|nr:hypothetical protein TNCV_1544421 [Trichonephila clavipes]
MSHLVYADKPQQLDHLEDNDTVLLPIYGHKCWKKSSKIGRPDWTTSEPAVAVDRKSLKCEALMCRGPGPGSSMPIPQYIPGYGINHEEPLNMVAETKHSTHITGIIG